MCFPIHFIKNYWINLILANLIYCIVKMEIFTNLEEKNNYMKKLNFKNKFLEL